MIWLLSSLLSLAQFTTASSPAKKPPASKCPSLPFPALFSDSTTPSLLVFMSFSVPLESWKETSFYLEKLNGAFVLQGLPNNSFEELAKQIIQLRQKGIRAPILLDPHTFTTYNVTSSPTFVLIQDSHHDKISDRKFTVHQILRHSFVHALITPADEYQMLFSSKFFCNLLAK
jgi:type-F conjugative transfer system pilin assembly protein TrbC